MGTILPLHRIQEQNQQGVYGLQLMLVFNIILTCLFIYLILLF